MDYKSVETQEIRQGHLPPRSFLPISSHSVNRAKPSAVVMTFSGSPRLTCGIRRPKEVVMEPKEAPKITRVTGSTTDHRVGLVDHVVAPSSMSTKPRRSVQLLSNDDSIELARPKKKLKKAAPAACPPSRPRPRPTKKIDTNHPEPKLKKMFKKMLIVRAQEKKVEEEARRRRVEKAAVQRNKNIQMEREAARRKLEKMEEEAAAETLFSLGVTLPPQLQFLK